MHTVTRGHLSVASSNEGNAWHKRVDGQSAETTNIKFTVGVQKNATESIHIDDLLWSIVSQATWP
jgi:hypothetical protein